MNKADLITDIAANYEIPKLKANAIVDHVFDALHVALARGEEVRFVGFGSFTVHDRPASEGRNPRTGEKMQIAAKRTVKFRPGAELRNAVNKAR